MTLHEAMDRACAVVGIKPPRRWVPGRWAATDTLAKNGKGDGRVLVFDDQTGGFAWNHQTGMKEQFSLRGQADAAPIQRPRRDPERERREAEEAAEVARLCARIVATCRQDTHPYLARKGFPDELGLVHDDPRRTVPAGRFGEMIAAAMPETDQPVLIVPGRIGKAISTVQFITAEGAKKNILRGKMGGAAHRIAAGRQPVVCEGIATALSVRAALRLLGVSATVLSAFSASNVAAVAKAIPGALIAADNDKPVESFQGKGTGEFYATLSGCRWTMPAHPGDFNDWHQTAGLRAVAIHLREVLG